jgi:hypothetical protein
MLWTRRRGREPRGRHRAAVTTAVPPVPAPPVTVLPVPVQPVPVLAPHVPASAPVERGSGVHLGFADGSALELASGDPRVGTFRAVARTLRG